ncbi:cobyric acid synthase [Maridesulfovibrio hydrothermalis]|uniref:Cobyric acid synthase n=1 Tax=Maridesulfovibrio hydrothermalis AM13 = DSM 14728 TaxID=1121451 RepID=L0R975_9BACT|nr:cobyric acid synthase [Maridesulfovibrio hydrothermalis]CCO23304.1 putative Adenosylcobalamin biosynthesis bifunctional protein CobDQ [Includes: threonine-phosphate decarboxylase; Cobyric acid synthase] [Maridesulfovibrio hydrothermalis AM13 = DSM 14728]
MQSLQEKFSELAAEEGKYAHGGNLRKLAARAGCPASDIIDFSANINPLGPPLWLQQEIVSALSEVDRYPDPECAELTLAACEKYSVWPNECLAGNGASELIAAITRIGGFKRAVIPVPCYVDYTRSCKLAGLKTEHIPLDPQKAFAPDFDTLSSLLSASPALVFLAQPNNPTGTAFDPAELKKLARKHPDSRFIVDESFADFVPDLERLTGNRPPNVITIVSLTKFYAIPGLRLGLAFASADIIMELKNILPCWSVNILAQKVGLRCICDEEYERKTIETTVRLREELIQGIMQVPGIRILPSQANFMLCQIQRVGMDAAGLIEHLLKNKVAVRHCDNFDGLDSTYFRIAVRTEEENKALVDGLRSFSGMEVSAQKPKKTPALMIQGTCSNAGKSILAAAFCRIFLQDGYKVAPFKAQNMSLNSFVTEDGLEMGRAQVTQAAACKMAPDVRMNPVLLKPNSDIGSQVIVMGKPVGNMKVKKYVEYKPTAFEAVKKGYDSLSADADIMVIEGAGSPAEINLKQHDIVNMAMAQYAEAKVIITGDIDRGGVFASLSGTMDLLETKERDLVCGFLLNKFRGDASLLTPALDFILNHTGKPVLGTIPFINNLGLPDEDSVSFKEDLSKSGSSGKHKDCVDIVCIDLPRISNFTDLDALKGEPDVNLRIVDKVENLGKPDAIILPGSKSTLSDLAHLRESGLAQAVSDMRDKAAIIGICGGFQMLGQYISDPDQIESETGIEEGLGLLPLQTTLAPEKTLTRTSAIHSQSKMEVSGYEIHHGKTEPLLPTVRAAIVPQGITGGVPVSKALGFGSKSGMIWGTYLHGIFDADRFRRWFIDSLRAKKGLPRLEKIQTTFGMEESLDHLADVVRENVDMKAIYAALKL